ncbi:hypothetical protein [Rhodococcus koreensis]|uniref:hypothetical protein n=1 Tax=Rhodococcus koreensis TaxID=99653 RepID=UPI00197DA376|nr:hypothetical protein [Rhodococcus koreensis]QSE87095.1 hypothetical protein JWS14_49555 [Rhodococcus koreensis]
MLTFLVPGLLFIVTAFRPERSPELTMMLNDMSWIFLIMPFTPFMVQNFAFAYAIFSDKRQQPLFPRWLGYVNIWAPIMFTPVVIVPFFRSGPFAWSGSSASGFGHCLRPSVYREYDLPTAGHQPTGIGGRPAVVARIHPCGMRLWHNMLSGHDSD